MKRRYSVAAVAVGRRVTEMRESAGLGLREAARRAKITPGHWSTIETGNSCPTVGVLYKMARGLGVTVHDLIPLAQRGEP